MLNYVVIIVPTDGLEYLDAKITAGGYSDN